MPLPEQVRLELEAIDAAVRGEAVDPEFAELAELALLLTDSRPELTQTRAIELDRRVRGLAAPRVNRPRRPRIQRPAWGAGLAVVALLAVLVIVLPRGGGNVSDSFHSSAGDSKAASSSASGASGGLGSSAGAASAPETLAAPTPESNGRRTIQTSQLSLSTPDSRIATVAQELFDVVGAEQGIVKHSQVSTGTGAMASFTLSIPTTNLAAALARLAQLRYASVTSSTETTTDVNSRYLDDQRGLADAKALRTSLLTQLAAASTTAAIDSLKAQIHAAESAIGADEQTLNALQSQISYSVLSVQVTSSGAGPAPRSGGGGFTIARAGHDALDVLRTVAGVALIALAVLIPLGVLLVLGTWLRIGWRRQRRERALDAG